MMTVMADGVREIKVHMTQTRTAADTREASMKMATALC